MHVPSSLVMFNIENVMLQHNSISYVAYTQTHNQFNQCKIQIQEREKNMSEKRISI